MNARQFLSAITTSALVFASVLPIFGKLELTANSNSIIPGINVSLPAAQAANYMDDYFADGNVVSLNNYGQFLNLHFLTKGGMIQSSNADGTDDQKFRVIRKAGTNQIQLERINSDRMIITPSAFVNQAPLEAWQRNLSIPFHGMQTWYVDVARTPGTFWLKPLGAPQFALNLPYGRNNVKSTLAVFDPNDRDMEWNVQVHSRGNGTPVPQPQVVIPTPPVVQPQTVRPTTQPVVTPPKPVCPGYMSQIFSREVKYEAVLAAIQSGKINWRHPGHSISGLVRTTKLQFSNGNCGVENRTEVYYKTIGAEGPFKAPVTVLTATKINGVDSAISSETNPGYNWDMDVLRRYYNEGVPKYTNNWVYLRKEIKQDKFNAINNLSTAQLQNLFGCFSYNAIPLIEGSAAGFCHCGDVSVRSFGNATGSWEFNSSTNPNGIYNLLTKY
jgi:hypothetical protein